MVRELSALKRDIKVSSDRADEIEFQIQTFMEPAAALAFNGQKLVTWKSQQSSRFDQKAFAQDQPEVFAKYKRVSESRVFRLAKV